MPPSAFTRERIAALLLFAVFAFAAFSVARLVWSSLRTVAVVFLTLLMTRGMFTGMLPIAMVI